jgi:hypothetical protein
LFVGITKTFIQHITTFLSYLKVLVCKDVSERKNQLSVITDYFGKVSLAFIGTNLDKGSKNEAVKNIYHGNFRKPCRVAAKEPSSFLIEILACEGHMRHSPWLKLVSEVVDRVAIEVYKRFLVNCLKPEFIQVVGSSKFFTFQHFSNFIIRDLKFLVFLSVIRHDR